MKFFVRDEDDKEYEIEEVLTEKKDEAPAEETTPEVHYAELLPEEIEALKKLAVVADKLIALATPTEDTCHDEDEVECEEKETLDTEGEDAAEEAECEELEEVVDTDETKTRDSKKSVGSIEKRTKSHDSVDVDAEIAAAWAKRGVK